MFKRCRVTVQDSDGSIWGFILKIDLLATMDNLASLKDAGEISSYSIHVVAS